jgi:UDP-glucose 4-epimerase
MARHLHEECGEPTRNEMQILVTGRAGCIGSVIVEALLSRGHRVTVLDSLYKGHREAVAPPARLLEIDLGDRAAVGEALRRRSAPGGACNLGSGTGYSNREVTEAARRVTGHPIPVAEAPRRPGDPAALVASSERITAALGWRPRFPGIEEIVGSAWEWHRRRPAGDGPPAG